MSINEMNDAVKIDAISEQVFEHEKARVCLTPMGETSDNVAKKFNVTRLKQDQFAVESHRRAHYAQTNGLFDSKYSLIKVKLYQFTLKFLTRKKKKPILLLLKMMVSEKMSQLKLWANLNLPSPRKELPLLETAHKYPMEQLQSYSPEDPSLKNLDFPF
jgi:acetyl-CoA acetyltransferase